MSEELKKRITESLDECEIIPGIPTKDIDREMWDDFWQNTPKEELERKVLDCQLAVMKMDKAIFDIVLPTKYNVDDFRKKCKIIEDAERKGMPLAGFEERLLPKCKLVKRLEEEKKLNVCPIAIDNALSIAQAHDNQLVEKGIYEPSHLNLNVRKVERRCLDFPIEEDRIIDTPSGKTMRVVVGVNKKPDASGRMGYVSIQSLEKRMDERTLDKLSDMARLYRHFLEDGMRLIGLTNITRKILELFKDEPLKPDIVYTNADSFLPDLETFKRVGFTVGDLIKFLEKRLNIKVKIEDYWKEKGRETCVWARPTEMVKIMSPEDFKEAIKTLDKGETEAFVKRLKEEGWEIRSVPIAKDPAEYIENLEEMHKTSYETTPDIQNRYPYTTLLGVHTSSIFGWLEQEYNPYILQPLLANQLMSHIVEIDPEIGKLFLLSKIYEYQEMTPIEEINYDWIIKFIEKFEPVKKILTTEDYKEIVEITGAQVGYHIFIDEYTKKVEDYYDGMARRQAVYGIIDEWSDDKSGSEDNYIPEWLYHGEIDRMIFNTEMGQKLDEILAYTNIKRTDLTWNTSWAIEDKSTPLPYDAIVVYEKYAGYNEEEIQIESVEKEFDHVKNAEYLPNDFPLELFNRIMHDHLGFDTITDRAQYYYGEIPTKIQIWTHYYIKVKERVMATEVYERKPAETHNKLTELEKLMHLF